MALSLLSLSCKVPSGPQEILAFCLGIPGSLVHPTQPPLLWLDHHLLASLFLGLGIIQGGVRQQSIVMPDRRGMT